MTDLAESSTDGNQIVESPEENGLSVAPPPLLPFEIPESFVSIPNRVADNVSTYLDLVIRRETPGRSVNTKLVIQNAKNMFRDGVKYNDKLWMHHCASSMRELLIFLKYENFKNSLISIPELGVDENVDRIFEFLKRSLTYISDIVHFREHAKQGNYDKTYKGQGYGQIEKEEFLKNEAIYFEKVCIDIIYTLNLLFTNYCSSQK